MKTLTASYGWLRAAAICVLLCACGQRGDLYLPPEAPSEASAETSERR